MKGFIKRNSSLFTGFCSKGVIPELGFDHDIIIRHVGHQRNLPGLIILNLTISKVGFQLTFMLGRRQSVYQNSTLCLTIAILVHYEGLSI